MKKFSNIIVFSLLCCALSVFLPRMSFTEETNTKEMIALNFVDVEMPAVIKFVSEITGYNFIYDEKIKGTVTVMTPTKLSIDEAFNLFTSILSIKGFTIIPVGEQTFKIIQASLARHTGTIARDDVAPVNERYISRLIPINHIEVEESLKFLRPVISKDGHISAFGPRNMLLIVDSAANIEKIMFIINEIDKPPTYQDPKKIHVYPLENADAVELAKVLEGIITTSKKIRQTKARAKEASPVDFATEVTVTPDKATNSLIIVAAPSDYHNIVQVIQMLDKRRKQVFVEAMIIEASIDELQELGSKWRITATNDREPVVIGGFGTVNTTSLLSLISGLSGFSGGGMGNFLSIPITTIATDGSSSTSDLTVPGFAALFSMQNFKDVINVLSTPQILTSDNEEAEIVVGENVPFISSRERDITTTNTVLSSIERKDVGIKLKLTPQITEGDYLRLNIYQEISAVKDSSENIITSVGPTTTKRSTRTSVVVKDSQTVVIGGLMQETEQRGVEKVPLLGDIPLFGWLFKYKTVSKEKTNLLVFLTPHIVKEASELSGITREKEEKFHLGRKEYVVGELMVQFKPGVSVEKAREIISGAGASVIEYIQSMNLYHIRLEDNLNMEEAVAVFSSIAEILYAGPNYKTRGGDNPRSEKPSDFSGSSEPLSLNPSSRFLSASPHA